MTTYAGNVVRASDPNDLNTRVTALEAKGYVTSATDTTSNVSTTTTEVVSTSVSFVATLSARYKVTYLGVAESTVAADLINVKLRWKNSASADITGTSFATDNKTAIAASKGDAFALFGDFNGQVAGTVTVVATIVRGAGATGTVKQNFASTGQQGYFLVESI
jgi:hypothetical protein